MTREERLFEDMKARLNMMCEYDARKGLNEFVLMPQNTTLEADDNPDDDAPAPGGDPAMGGTPAPGGDTAMGGASAPGGNTGMGGDPSMGGAPAPGGDPAMGGASIPGGDTAMDGAPAPGDDPEMGDAQQGPEGFNPQGPDPAMGGDPSMDGDISADSFDTQQPGDEVLDVTELTDKQDEIEKEIHSVGGKFEEVLKAIGSFEELLRSNDEKIENLKAEIERRNPTQIEKLGNRKNLSYPFNVTPEEYWDNKESTSNYSTEDDDNGKEQGQYVITANDVNGDTNWHEIAKSLDDKDFLYNQTLDKLLKF